jgi:predicted metal-dependent HD superfamily phosphohydrolase
MNESGLLKGRLDWRDLLRGWGVGPLQADCACEEVRKAYSDPGSFYHTLDHVLAVLTTVETFAAHARNLGAVKLAAWVHDVVHDSKGSDNEERSAQYVEELGQRLGIPQGPLVAALVRTTKNHEAGEDVDAQVLQ